MQLMRKGRDYWNTAGGVAFMDIVSVKKFDEGYDNTDWTKKDESCELVEVERKGNHGRNARNFVFKRR